MEQFHDILRWSHISVGFVGLILFWFPVLSKKGGRLHIVTGKMFVVCAYFMVGTAAISCTWALVSPSTFTSFGDSMTSEEVKSLNADIRFFFTILAVVASWVFQDLVVGMRALKIKLDETAMQGAMPIGACYVTAAINAAAVAFGGTQLLSGGNPRNWALVVLGLIGAEGVTSNIRFIRNPRKTKMAWWYKHMECMLGSGVGFYTAFFVFGAGRLIPGMKVLEGPLAIVPWILPGVVGGTAISIWVRKYKRKFGELKPAP